MKQRKQHGTQFEAFDREKESRRLVIIVASDAVFCSEVLFIPDHFESSTRILKESFCTHLQNNYVH